LVIKIELWPGGDDRRAKEIGRMEIIRRARSLTHGGRRADYDVALLRRGSITRIQKEGEVLGYPRLSYSVWTLVRRALEAVGCKP